MADAQRAAPSLTGKTAIVTGAGSGIGQAIAVLFAARGARVALLDVGDARSTVEMIGASGGDALPATERASREVLSLPMYPELTEDHIRKVAEGVRGFTGGAA